MPSRLSFAAAFVVALWLAPFASATPAARPTTRSPTVAGIERGLANALARAKSTRLVHFRRQRYVGRRALPGYQLEWVDLATAQGRLLSYDASGQRLRSTSLPLGSYHGGWNPSSACGCDLDPPTDFAGRTLDVSLLGDQMVDGQPTFHLRFTVVGGVQPSTTDFWIDRSTYLPVRSKVVYGGTLGDGKREPIMSTIDAFTWLPRSRANLARLASG